MSRLSRLLLFAAAAAALGLCPAASRANYEDPTVTFGTTTPLNLDFSTSLPLPQFNPTLGTLESVKITLNGTLEAPYSASNSTGGPLAFGIYSFGQMTLSAPENETLNVPLGISQQFTLQAHTSVSVRTGGSSPPSNSGTQSYTYQGSLNPFIGTGTFAVTVTGSRTTQMIPFNGLLLPVSSSIVSYNAQGGGSVVQEGFGSVTVDYTFKAAEGGVPEPAAVVLLASGVGIVLLARRHAARARGVAEDGSRP